MSLWSKRDANFKRPRLYSKYWQSPHLLPWFSPVHQMSSYTSAKLLAILQSRAFLPLSVLWLESSYLKGLAGTEREWCGCLQNIVNYYFGRTYIAPQDVSQQLFKVNLTAIASNLTDPDVASLVAATQTAGGQAVVSRASTADQDNINALQSRITSLTSNITALNSEIQVNLFSLHVMGPHMKMVSAFRCRWNWLSVSFEAKKEQARSSFWMQNCICHEDLWMKSV